MFSYSKTDVLQILALAKLAVHVFWLCEPALTSVGWRSAEPSTTPSAVICERSYSLSSYSAGNYLNELSRPEWGQQDEVMSRRSLTWSRLGLRSKISCVSAVLLCLCCQKSTTELHQTGIRLFFPFTGPTRPSASQFICQAADFFITCVMS